MQVISSKVRFQINIGNSSTEGQKGALSWLAVPATVTPPLRQRRRNDPNPQPQEPLTGEGVTCRYP